MRLLFVVNTDWFFLSHRLPIALEAKRAGFEVHIATAVTDKLSELQTYGFEVHPIGLVRSKVAPLNALKTLLELYNIFKIVEPTIVHLITIKPLLLGGLVARWTRVPALVSAVSGLGYTFMAEGLIARFRKWCAVKIYSFVLRHKNQIIIFQNINDRDLLINFTGISKSKTLLVRGSGVNLIEYKAEPETLGKPIVLFPARLLVDKGIFEFVTAAKLLRNRGSYARFVLAGMLDLDNPTSITRIQLDQWIKMGLVEYWGCRTDMPRVIASAHIVVLPSYREGLPKVLLEAAAVGRAVVTTDVPGCRDAIKSDVTGVLVPARDAVGLALAIEDLLKNPNQRIAMGLAGRRLAEKEFDVCAVVTKHMDIYKKLTS